MMFENGIYIIIGVSRARKSSRAELRASAENTYFIVLEQSFLEN